jgi:hypothetical protein
LDGKLRIGPCIVVSQAVFQNIAAGHPKFEARRELLKCAPTQGIQRVDCVAFGRSANQNKSTPKKSPAASPPNEQPGEPCGAGPQPLLPQCGRKERTPPCLSRSRSSRSRAPASSRTNKAREIDFTAASRRAGLPNELHPEFELAKSMAVPNPSSNSSEVWVDQPIGRHKNGPCETLKSEYLRQLLTVNRNSLRGGRPKHFTLHASRFTLHASRYLPIAATSHTP